MKIHLLIFATVTCIACTGVPPQVAAAPSWRIVPSQPVAPNVAVVKLFDDRIAPGIPGPVATPETVRRTLAARLAEGRDTVIAAGLPYFGYLWRGKEPPIPITLDEARHVASESNVEIVRDPVSGSLHAIQPNAWELWIVDDEQLRALTAEVQSLGVRRIVLFVKR